MLLAVESYVRGVGGVSLLSDLEDIAALVGRVRMATLVRSMRQELSCVLDCIAGEMYCLCYPLLGRFVMSVCLNVSAQSMSAVRCRNFLFIWVILNYFSVEDCDPLQ